MTTIFGLVKINFISLDYLLKLIEDFRAHFYKNSKKVRRTFKKFELFLVLKIERVIY